MQPTHALVVVNLTESASTSDSCGGNSYSHFMVSESNILNRENGKGELYAYLPVTPSNTERLLSIPPRSIQHPDYGFSAGRGAFKFTPGRWTTVAERVKLNTVGQSDG